MIQNVGKIDRPARIGGFSGFSRRGYCRRQEAECLRMRLYGRRPSWLTRSILLSFATGFELGLIGC
jgi:hypothetical protein